MGAKTGAFIDFPPFAITVQSGLTKRIVSEAPGEMKAEVCLEVEAQALWIQSVELNRAAERGYGRCSVARRRRLLADLRSLGAGDWSDAG